MCRTCADPSVRETRGAPLQARYVSTIEFRRFRRHRLPQVSRRCPSRPTSGPTRDNLHDVHRSTKPRGCKCVLARQGTAESGPVVQIVSWTSTLSSRDIEALPYPRVPPGPAQAGHAERQVAHVCVPGPGKPFGGSVCLMWAWTVVYRGGMRTRPVVVAVRLSTEEAALVDRARGGVSRSSWLRWMLLRYAKGQDK